MKNKLEQKVEKGQKLNRQEKEMKRIIDGGNAGDTFIPPVRLADAQQGEYNEYSKTNDDGEQVRTHTGMVILNPAVEFEEGTYNLVGMNDGDIQVGISALDGSINAGNGSVVINANGIIIYTTVDNLLIQEEKLSFKAKTTEVLQGQIFAGDTYNSSTSETTRKAGFWVPKLNSAENNISELNFAVQTDESYGPPIGAGAFKPIAKSRYGIYENDRFILIGFYNSNRTSVSQYDSVSASLELFTDNVNKTDSYISAQTDGVISLQAGTYVTINNALHFYGATYPSGVLSWNTDRDTLDLTQTGTTLQLGQEIHFYVKNQTGSTITDGTAVMFAGSLGASGILLATPAIADGTYSAIYIMGIATQDIPNGEEGKVTFFGEVRGIDTSMYSDGDILYLDPSTPGGLTNVAPSAPNLKYAIAAVVNANNNGTIFVRAIYTQNLSELNDVQISSPASGEVIKYDGSKWVNGTSTASIALNDLTDVVISTASTNQVLKFDGSNWVNAEVPQFLNPSYQLIAATECYGVGTSDLAPFARGAIGTGTLTFRTAEAAHPGMVRFDSVATNNTGYYIGLTGSYPIILSTGDECQAIFRFATNANNSNCNGAFGWMVDITNAAVTSADSLCLRWTGNGTTIDLGFYGRVGGVGSLANFATLSVNTWYRLKINNGGAGAVNAYVYNSSGTQLATYNYTGSITTAGQQFGIKGYRANNVATSLFDLDYMSLYSTTALAR